MGCREVTRGEADQPWKESLDEPNTAIDRQSHSMPGSLAETGFVAFQREIVRLRDVGESGPLSLLFLARVEWPLAVHAVDDGRA